MRVTSLTILLLVAACRSPQPTPVPRPQASQVLALAPGTRLATRVRSSDPDEQRMLATRSWWHAAVGQSERFCIAPRRVQRIVESDGRPQQLPLLELRIDAPARTATTVLLRDGDETMLAHTSFADDGPTPGLLTAIDHLAWASRIALGEPGAPPLPVAAITSRRPDVLVAVEDAAELIRTGSFHAARKLLQQARRRDGGAPFVLLPLAQLALLLHQPDVAERTAREALTYGPRTSPTTQHRLLRTAAMANAELYPSETANHDRKLLQIAASGRRERPHDDDPIWTEALAHNFAGEFAQARELLEHLQRVWPDHLFVSYHLGWACLGTGDAAEAAEHLARAALRLGETATLLPRAIALFEARRDDELVRLLDATSRLAAERDDSLLTHQVLRMQAAHAILHGERERAAALLFDDLRCLALDPLLLNARIGDFADAGMLLVRFGSHPDLPALLADVQRQNVTTAAADACTFLAAMHRVQATDRRAVDAEARLARTGDSVWSALLAAFAHERRGEVGDMQNELGRAARLSSSPLTKALLAKSLRAVGKDAEADRLQDALRRELSAVHLRRSCQHPLFGPEFAYACLVR